MSFALVYHLGDLRLTLALAAAIAAYLVALRARRAAARWIVAFVSALGLVAASKVAYLGWGGALPSPRFQALSGHAAGCAATSLVLSRLCTRFSTPALRTAALLAAVTLSVVVAASLVQAGEHTVAEASAGWLIGAVAARTTFHMLDLEPPNVQRNAPAWSLLAFALCMALAGAIPANAWLVATARALSGKNTIHRWHEDAADRPTITHRRYPCPDPPPYPSRGSPVASSTTPPCVR